MTLDLLMLLQTLFGGLAVLGIAWVLRQVVGVESEILQTRLGLQSKLNTGFRQINGRLSRVEEHMIGHEQLDNVRFDAAHEERDALRATDLQNEVREARNAEQMRRREEKGGRRE